MARIRSIKPEFWTSAQLLECSANARLLFIGTWTFADDAGRHPWSAKQLKAEIFPADDFTEQQVLAWLGELETQKLIVRYSHEGKEFFYIDGWKHQRIDKPQTPKYPDPFNEHSKIIRGVIPPDTIRYDTKGEDAIVEPSLRSGVRTEVSRETISNDDWPSDYRDKFWSRYPRKQSRKSAFKALDRIRKSGETTFAELMAGIEKIPIADPSFIPHAATWLNGARWDDEPVKPGVGNGYRGPRPLQDDAKSAGRAAGRLAQEARAGRFSFAPLPSLLPREGGNDVRQLSEGRGTEPRDLLRIDSSDV